jgi:hypothetical protein
MYYRIDSHNQTDINSILFYLYRNPRYHPDYLVYAGCNLLIDQSHGIPETSGKLIFRNNPGADFVGNQYNRTCRSVQAFSQTAGLSHQEIFWRTRIRELHHQIAHPERQTVHQQNIRVGAEIPDGLGEKNRRFHGGPVCAPFRLMLGNPLVHFIVTGYAGGQKYFPDISHPVRQMQGMAAFTASASADDKGSVHIKFPEDL